MIHKSRNAVQPFDFGGLAIREITPEALTSASVAEITVPPGAAHARARSTRSEKIYVGLTGEILFQVGDEEVRLRPGDALAIEAGRWFDYANREGEAARMLLVHVPPFDLEAEEFFVERA